MLISLLIDIEIQFGTLGSTNFYVRHSYREPIFGQAGQEAGNTNDSLQAVSATTTALFTTTCSHAPSHYKCQNGHFKTKQSYPKV